MSESKGSESSGGRLQEVWDRHWTAFQARDVDGLLADIDESIKVSSFMHGTDTATHKEGHDGVREHFGLMFMMLPEDANIQMETEMLDTEDFKQVTL